MNLNISNRNNSWDRYGSKSTRKKMCMIEYNQLQLQLDSVKKTKENTSPIIVNLNNLQSEIKRYDNELEQILGEANNYDKNFNLIKRRLNWLIASKLLSFYAIILLLGEAILKNKNQLNNNNSLVFDLTLMACGLFSILSLSYSLFI